MKKQTAILIKKEEIETLMKKKLDSLSLKNNYEFIFEPFFDENRIDVYLEGRMIEEEYDIINNNFKVIDEGHNSLELDIFFLMEKLFNEKFDGYMLNENTEDMCFLIP